MASNSNTASLDSSSSEYTPETFAAQADKTSNFSKLLQFLETPAAKKNCFHLIRSETRGEYQAIVGKVNNHEIVVSNANLTNKFKHRNPIKRVIGLADKYTPEEAKESFAACVFRRRGLTELNDETRPLGELKLQAWGSLEYMDDFMPDANIQVADYTGTKATINILVGGKIKAKATEASIHLAKHVACCQLLNLPEYRETFSIAGRRSHKAVMADNACPNKENYQKMLAILKANNMFEGMDTNCAFNEDDGTTQATFKVQKIADDADGAAKKVYQSLSTMSIKGNKKKGKKNKQPSNQGGPKAKIARVPSDNRNAKSQVGVLFEMCQKLKCGNPNFEEVETPDSSFQFALTYGDGQSCIGGGSSKKGAKIAAAEIAVNELIAAHPEMSN